MRDASPAQPPAARPRLPRAPRTRCGERGRPVAGARRGALQQPGAGRRDSGPAVDAARRAARTYTPSRTYTPVSVAPSGPTAAQRAAAPPRPSAGEGPQGRRRAARERHQMQLLAAAQTHAEAVLRAELKAARETNAVDLLAGSVAESIGAVPAGDLPSTAAASAGGSSGGGASFPMPALMLAACAGAARHRRRLRLAPRRRVRDRGPAAPRPPARGNLTCAHACSSPSPYSPGHSSSRPRRLRSTHRPSRHPRPRTTRQSSRGTGRPGDERLRDLPRSWRVLRSSRSSG